MGLRIALDADYIRFPGTIHHVNRHPIGPHEDEILISEFGRIVRWVGVALCLYALLVAINLIAHGIRNNDDSIIPALVAHTTSPVLAIFIGILLTFMAQSSTVVVTVVVAAVGSGLIPLDLAVMLTMGANIGTCFSAQLVAFGLYRAPGRLEPALAAAMTHWWFNTLSVMSFFLIERIFHPFTALAGKLSDFSFGPEATAVPTTSFVAALIEPVASGLGSAFLALTGDTRATSVLCVAVGVLVVTLAMQVSTILLGQIMIARSHNLLTSSTRDSYHPGSATKPFLAGLGISMATHSSSATICSSIPFAGAQTLSTRSALYLVVGANLGTTITPALSGLVVTGQYAVLGVEAALIHVLFNLAGVVLILAFRPIAELILWLSEATAQACAKAPKLGFILVIASYTAVPIAAIALVSLS